MSIESNFLSFSPGGSQRSFPFVDTAEPYLLRDPSQFEGGPEQQGAGRRIQGWLRMVRRAFWVSLWIGRTALEFCLFVGRDLKKSTTARRAWLKRTAQGVLGAMDIEVRVEGRPPKAGLLVSNHLSYLDILVLASVAPAIFVAKQEVNSWPIFGWLARCAGTIFVNREKRTDVGRVGEEIKQALENGAVVVLFPAGTSSNGRSVLPFRSSLLAPALGSYRPVNPAALDYQMADGSVENEVCYWGDMVLGPHLLHLLSKKKIEARVSFGAPVRSGAINRKSLAAILHENVSTLKARSHTNSVY